MSLHSVVSSLLAILCGTAFVLAEDAPDPKAVSRVTVVDDEGRSHSGLLAGLTADALTFEGPEAGSLSRVRLLRMTFRRAERRIDTGPYVLLANGDRLALRVESIEEDRLAGTWIEYPARPAVSIPLEMVRGVVFSAPERAEPQRRLFAELRDRRDDSDLVVLTKGDRVTGTFERLTGTKLEVDGPGGKFQLDRADVRALAFNAALVSFPKFEGRYELLELSDGSRVTVKELAAGPPGAVRAEALFGGTLEFLYGVVASVGFAGGRAVFLSELPVEKYEHTPYLSAEWKLGLDRSPLGGPLRLRGVEYGRGLGMHSRSSVEYRLDGKFARFLSLAGIDDETHGGGNVVFAVEVDGERVFTSAPQTGRSEPLAVGPIDLTGRKSLRLVVEYGERADVQDHAVWCDPVLIRAAVP